MMLTGKVAVVYGAAGAVGSAVAQAFVAEGATVRLAGRRPEALRKVAEAIGGRTETAEVDALDEDAVERDVQDIVDRHGRLDVSVNLIAVDHSQGVPLVRMRAADFARGVDARVRTQFITATAAARAMAGRRTGVILMLTASPDRTGIGRAGSFGVQCAAVESLSRALAVELGPSGVRVACLRSAGSPDAAGVDAVFDVHAGTAGTTREEFDTVKAGRTLLGRLPRLAEVARVAVFLASDHASAVTASITNVTCGELLD